MTPFVPEPDSAREITVLRALALGDLLCSVPFFRALRAGFPKARITLIGLPWASELVRRLDRYIDAFQPFPGWPGIPEVPFQAARASAFIDAARACPADLAIQLQGNGRWSNTFVVRLGARRTGGFVPPTTNMVKPTTNMMNPLARASALRRPQAAALDVAVPYPARIPEVRRHLALWQALSGDDDVREDTRLELPVRPEDHAELDAILQSMGPPGRRLRAQPFAILHPGAADPARRWAADRFAAVGDHLAAQGLLPAVTGVAAEARQTSAVIRKMRHQAVNLTGRTSLGALAALVSRAGIVVSNDTGMSHVADAVGCPSVVLFLGSDPVRWAPLDRIRHVAVVAPDLGPGCAASGRPGHPECGVAGCLDLGAEPRPSRQSIDVADVVRAVDRLLARAAPALALAVP
jgi:ADP-heptose:LPS heptosyltransferase